MDGAPDPGLLTILVVLAALVAVGAVIMAVIGGRRAARAANSVNRLTESASRLAEAQQQLSGHISQLSTASAASQAALQQTLNERLDQVTKRLGDSLSETSEKTGKTLTELHTRLAMIDEARKHITELSTQVVGLQDILANKQARGAFGEVQLADLVQSTLPPSAYSLQHTLSNGRRVDCLIRLPNPPGPIAVDAKFPLESYRRLREAKDEAALQAARRTFATDIQKHIADIAERYLVAGETADSALLFLPSEAIYAELHANFPGLVERSYRARVWIVSPTTMMATLNTVRAVLKDARMREQAGVIQKYVLELLDDVERLERRVDNLQKHFGQAERDIREIGTSTAKIVRRAERIEELQLEDEEDKTEEVGAALAPPDVRH